MCVLVSDREPNGVVPPSPGRTVLQVPMGQAERAKIRSQSVDQSSLHTFGAVWMKPQIRSAGAHGEVIRRVGLTNVGKVTLPSLMDSVG
jgi:hypothetical protein